MSQEQSRLLCDAMLGRLCTYLRMCGYDTASTLERDVDTDDAIAALARTEDRVLLTRDRALARRVNDAILIDSRDIDDKLQTLIDAGFDLSLSTPTRCSSCNGVLVRVPDKTTTPPTTPDPALTPVWECSDCGQLYWKGSHWADVARRLSDLRSGP